MQISNTDRRHIQNIKVEASATPSRLKTPGAFHAFAAYKVIILLLQSLGSWGEGMLIVAHATKNVIFIFKFLSTIDRQLFDKQLCKPSSY